MQDLSPLDVLGKTFKREMRGCSAREVHDFLAQVAGTMEALMRERGESRQQVHRLEQELAAHRERQSALQEALVAAQQAAERTLEVAKAEGQRIVDEGQALADRLIEEAYKRAQNIETIIGDLRTRRRQTRSELMRLVEVLQGVVRDDQETERIEPSTPQLALLPRWKNGAAKS